MQRSIPVAIGVALLCLALGAAAQNPSSYPAKDQTADQQKKDDGECLSWAKQSTGIDPAQPAPPPAQTPPPQGGRAKGAAAVGAIGGNDVGDAAVKGAA